MCHIVGSFLAVVGGGCLSMRLVGSSLSLFRRRAGDRSACLPLPPLCVEANLRLQVLSRFIKHTSPHLQTVTKYLDQLESVDSFRM